LPRFLNRDGVGDVCDNLAFDNDGYGVVNLNDVCHWCVSSGFGGVIEGVPPVRQSIDRSEPEAQAPGSCGVGMVSRI